MQETRLTVFMKSTTFAAVLASLVILALVGLRESLLAALGGAVSLFSLEAYRIFSAFVLLGGHVRLGHAVSLVVFKLFFTLAIIFGVLLIAGTRGLVFFLIGYLAFVPASILFVRWGGGLALGSTGRGGAGRPRIRRMLLPTRATFDGTPHRK